MVADPYILAFTAFVLLHVYALGRHEERCRELERAYTPKPRPLTRPEARGSHERLPE